MKYFSTNWLKLGARAIWEWKIKVDQTFETRGKPSWGERVNIQDGLCNGTNKRLWCVEIKLGHIFFQKKEKEKREKMWTSKCHGSFQIQVQIRFSWEKKFSKICWACIINGALIFVFEFFDETIFIRSNRVQDVD